MDKQQLLKQLIQQLEETLDLLIRTAQEAKSMATDEESKAENKYDTRGLEASYLAAGQAQRASQLKLTIKNLKELKLNDKQSDKVALTSLIKVQIDGKDEERWLFLLPFAGGHSIQENVQSITPNSPVGRQLLGLQVGDGFEVGAGEKSKEYEIVSVI